jgi:hypothetical protein
LEAADKSSVRGEIDLTAMEELLSGMLARQLVAVHDDAKKEE